MTVEYFQISLRNFILLYLAIEEGMGVARISIQKGASDLKTVFRQIHENDTYWHLMHLVYAVN